MRKSLLLILFYVLMTTVTAYAQGQQDSFMEKTFSITRFKINSKLKDIKADKYLGSKLTFLKREDDNYLYALSDQKINLPDVKKSNEKGAFYIELIFRDDRLMSVIAPFKVGFIKDGLNETIKQFDKEYGKSRLILYEENINKRVIWNVGNNELEVRSYQNSSFEIYYGIKPSAPKKTWLYSDRNGKGSGTFQLTLPYFEKSLESNLTILSFEKCLPKWHSIGTDNHVEYGPDWRRGMERIPCFEVVYEINNCRITITTSDTVSKIISGYILDRIKDADIEKGFDKDLKNLDYKIRPPKYPDEGITGYHKEDILVGIAKDHSMIFIDKNLIKLP